MKKRRVGTFKFKLIFFITLLTAAISASLYIYLLRHSQKDIHNSINKQVELVKEHLKTGAESLLINNNEERLESILSVVMQQNNLSYLIVCDSTGKALYEMNINIAREKGFKGGREVNEIQFEDFNTVNIVTPVINQNVYAGTLFFGFSKSEFITTLDKDKVEFRIICSLLVVAGFLISLLFVYFSTGPFRKILRITDKILGGAYTEKIKIKGRGEFASIGTALNYLAEHLDDANSQILHLNKQLKSSFRDKLGELNLEINQRRIAEASLKQSEEQFRLLFDIAPIGMVITDSKRKIQKVNFAFERTLGYTAKELQDKSTIDLTYYEDRTNDERIYKDFIKGEIESNTYEKRYVTKKGNIIDVVNRAILYKDDDKKTVQFIEQVIDITEQKKMQTDLISAKEHAEESDKMKSAFLAQMSHEIRTPLNVILAASNIFEEELKEFVDEESQEIIESVKSAGKRLLRTIDLILNMSAIQTGKYQPEFEKMDLNIEIKKQVDEFKTLSTEKKLKLSFSSHTDDAVVKADKYTVQQIFQNLISNAIKYTRQGSVEVVIFKTDKVFVEIKDSGIGMSKDYMAKIFNPFSQEDVGQKREFEGNGLGLALVKKYVDINEATIKVESEKDKGSKFTVIFNN